jgi:hypothetical protein
VIGPPQKSHQTPPDRSRLHDFLNRTIALRSMRTRQEAGVVTIVVLAVALTGQDAFSTARSLDGSADSLAD